MDDSSGTSKAWTSRTLLLPCPDPNLFIMSTVDIGMDDSSGTSKAWTSRTLLLPCPDPNLFIMSVYKATLLSRQWTLEWMIPQEPARLGLPEPCSYLVPIPTSS
ncbi:hypothetical protein M8J76_002829 [Diaphorina citri]|nr:hypothetical protein M8J76_002829 [Diaphorina citri]KAI5718952.1 hypothetical protein M8J76_002829 [Diaphorina citri]